MQRLPLAFEPNPDHSRTQSDYIVRSGLMFAELSATETRLYLPSAKDQAEGVFIRLEGANLASISTASERLPGESNYILSDDPATWHTHVAQFGRVTYNEVYPGIDLTYYGSGNKLEHDFIVHQGSSPSAIRIRFRGAHKLTLTEMGELQIGLEERTIVLRKPLAYQMVGGDRREVPARFELAGDSAHFRIGQYDHSKPLIIDPVLDYSTFIGNASVYVTGVATDANGNVYITGEAPATFGASADSATCSSCVTATNKLAVYVTRLNSTGTSVLYSTFLGGSTDPYGGSSNDQSSLIAVDANGNAIVSGWTSSTDFPTKSSITAGVPSFEDGFLTSLSPDGSSLNFSSRIGGSSSGSSSAMTYPGALTVDSSGNIYLAGETESPYLPVTSGALKNATPAYGNTAAFLMKLSAQGALIFSGIPGGLGSASGSIGPSGVAVDGDGIIYLTGTAGTTVFPNPSTTPWPTTAGAYQSNLISPGENAPFVTRVSADGTTILSSTLVGTGSSVGLTLTPTHDVIIAGTGNYNFPVTADAYNSNVSTSVNGVISLGALGFFAKVSSDGTKLLYSSAFGPSSTALTISGLAQDSRGDVWLAGTTSGPFTDLVHPLQSVFTSSFSGNGFVSEFDPSLHTLLFESYVNSATGFSQVHGLAIDSSDHVHVAGIASMDFPTTANAFLRSVTAPPPNYTYNYGFAATIDTSQTGPGICFANQRSATVVVGSTGTGSFDIVSCGDGPLTISSLQLTSSIFTLNSNTCVGTLATGQSCTVSYSFSPTTAGPYSTQLSIGSDAPMGPGVRTIFGTATAPIVFLPGSSTVTFQPQVLGSTPQSGAVLIFNKGTAPLVIDTTRTTITGPFALSTTSCNVQILPNSGCIYSFTFNPTVAGAATGSVVIFTNDPVTPTVTIALNGTALAQYPQPAISRLVVPSISLDGGVASVSISGSNFFPASTVLVNGISVPVKSSNNSTITVSVDPAILGQLGEYPVQVVNPAPGGTSNVVQLTAFHLIPLTSTVTVFNPHSKLLYVAIPSTAATNANTILPIDPATGTFGTPIPVLNNPTCLALSDDGQYLYVGFYYLYGASPPPASLQRINLQTGTVDRTFTLPGSSNGILDMHVVPGTPTSVLVALSRAGSPSENGVALFNDSGLVQYIPNDYSSRNYTLDNFTFTSDPSTYYGYPFGSAFFASGTLNNTGITPIAGGFSCCDQASGSIVVSDGTLLYTNSGQVWDPKQQKLLGRYDSNLFYEPAIVADATAKRTFILRGDYQPTNNGSQYPAIASYDPSTLGLSGVLYFPLTGTPGSLTRWNIDGFGFLTGTTTTGDWTNPYTYSQLMLVRSSLANPSGAIPASITSLSPNTAPAGSSALTITVNGSGFTAGSTVLWNGTTRITTFVSATQITVAITAADLAAPGTVSVAVSTNGNVTSNLPFTITGPVLALSSSTLTFPSQTIGTASAALSFTLQNSGLIPISGISFALGGTDAANFSNTSTCGVAIAAGATCTVNVIFTPTSVGQKQASIQVSSSAGSQTVTLYGTSVAPDFTISPPASTNATVASGQPAALTLNLAETGTFSGTVSMSCTNLPTYASCTFTPATFTLTPAPTVVTLSIATQQLGATAAKREPELLGRSSRFIALAGLLVLPWLSRWRLPKSFLLALLTLTLSIGPIGCSGSSSAGDKTPTPTPQKTPAGTYNITINATSGNVSHSTNVTLIVQ